MILYIAGLVSGVVVTWYFIGSQMLTSTLRYHDHSRSWTMNEIIGVGLVIMLVGLCGLIGLMVGWFASLLIGMILPQKQNTETFELRSFKGRPEQRVSHYILVGKVNVPVYKTEHVYYYSYVDHGVVRDASVDESYAEVVWWDRPGSKIQVDSWSFVWRWAWLFASTGDPQYKFFIEKR